MMFDVRDGTAKTASESLNKVNVYRPIDLSRYRAISLPTTIDRWGSLKNSSHCFDSSPPHLRSEGYLHVQASYAWDSRIYCVQNRQDVKYWDNSASTYS